MMTIVIAFRCDTDGEEEGIIIASDTQATDGITAIEVEKIVPIVYGATEEGVDEKYIAIASGAGHAGIVRQFIRLAEQILIEHFENDWEFQEPNYNQFEEAILEIQDEYIERLSIWRKNNFHPSIELLICGLSPDGKASMYQFDSDGAAMAVHASPGFAGLGHGFSTGGNLILKQFWNPSIDVEESTMLSAYIIEMVSLVDPTVGEFDGSIYLFRIEDGRPALGGMKSDSLEETIEQIQPRKENLENAWILCNKISDDEMNKILKRVARKNEIDLTDY